MAEVETPRRRANSARGIPQSLASFRANSDRIAGIAPLRLPHRPNRSRVPAGGCLYPRRPQGRGKDAVHRAGAPKTFGATDSGRFRLRSSRAGLGRAVTRSLHRWKSPWAKNTKIRFFRSRKESSSEARCLPIILALQDGFRLQVRRGPLLPPPCSTMAGEDDLRAGYAQGQSQDPCTLRTNVPR
jgi:hypothetical protein